MGAMVTVFAPDGTQGQIPQSNVQAAVKAGGKVGVHIYAPDGTEGYVPQDRVADAMHSGATMEPKAAQQGFLSSLADSTGLSSAYNSAKQEVTNAVQHPVDTALDWMSGGPAQRAAQGVVQMGLDSAGQVKQAYQSARAGNVAGVAQHAVTAIPIVGPALDKASDQYADKNYAGEAGTLLGTAATVAPMVAGGIEKVGGGPALRMAGDLATSAAGVPGDALAAAKSRFYPTSQSITPQVESARNLAKALVVAPAGAPNFIRAATDEAGTVVAHAQDTGMPINSKLDFANAAKSAADTVQAHFGDTILGPNISKTAAVPASYRGATVGEGPNATLGAINDRINAINQELNPNFRKGLASQTSAANVSDADLIAEKQALTNILHTKLADATGLQPSDIASVRQQAGKLRTIADEASLSANQDTAAAGKQAMGATTSAVGTKVGLIDRALQYAQGGPEIIGNRQINRVLGNIQPKPLNLPQPTSTGITPPPIPVRGLQKWANDGALKVTQHLQGDPSSGVTASDIQQASSDPAVRQLLINASDLTPGSKAMTNLIQQIKTSLGGDKQSLIDARSNLAQQVKAPRR